MAIFRMFRAFPKLKEKKKIFLEFLLTKNSFFSSSSSISSSPSFPSLSPSPPITVNSSVLPLPTIDHDKKVNLINNRGIMNSPLQYDKIAIKENSSQLRKKKKNDNKNEKNDNCYPINQILILIRKSCAVTQRTKIYLETVSLLHSISYLPQNIGSVFSAGGSPMLEQLRISFGEMLLLNGKLSMKVK